MALLNAVCFILCTTLATIRGQDTCREGDVRLGGGNSELEGRVEICIENIWGTVCDDSWDDNDAIVVCRQLGHSSNGARAITASNSRYEVASGPIYFDNVECTGTEKLLVNCTSLGFRQHNCVHFEDAGVACEAMGFSCEDGDIRLADGDTIYEGRVEVCLFNKYTTVCDDSEWGASEAAVVCQQLNFTSTQGSIPIAIPGGSFGPGYGDINLSGLRCNGMEPNLTACFRSPSIFSGFCTHSDDGGVLCPQPNPPCDNGDIRLLGGLSPNEGRIEICFNGHWGTVCHRGWGRADAQVVCRQLGYSTEDAIAVGYQDFGAGSGLVFLSNVRCNGSERTLISCPSWPIANTFCTHASDSGVICQDPNNTCTNGNLRLVDGNKPNEGRLQICFMNHWGTVCDDDFDGKEATLVCKQLGYPSEGAIGLHAAYFGPGVGLILLDNLDCVGNETSLFNCSHLGIGASNCLHIEDVSVICQDVNSTCTNGDVRLVNGTGSHSGRVEVCFNGIWGTVCDDNWDTDDATVVCNQLNFTGVSVGLKGAYFGEGTGPIFLDDTDCSPYNHSNLVECFDVQSAVGVHNCAHSEDASVICSFGNRTCNGTLNGGIRLIGGRSVLEGRVELCLDGEWGTICDNFWSNFDAITVCRELALGHTDARAIQGAMFGQGTGPIHLDRFFCTGEEHALIDCDHFNPMGSECTHAQDASVICSGSVCTRGDVRLVGGRFPSEGRVEVCINENFGTVCNSGWNNPDAAVVCRQLGYGGEGAIALSELIFGPGTQEIVLNRVGCTGEERTILECSSQTSNIFCFHAQDSSVLCQSESASLVCTNGDIRLAGRDAPYEGEVEVCFNDRWGTICHDDWDVADALIVCRILGYDKQNIAIPTLFNYFNGNLDVPVLLSEVQCNGTETRFLDCLSVNPGDHDCSHFRDAGVFCSVYNSSFECQTGDVRLVNGQVKNEGRVEICINGNWGTVCDNGWGTNEAAVVCRQLGFDPGRPVGNAAFGAGVLPIYFSNFQCTGVEDNLMECPNRGPETFCRHNEDAGVICRVSICSDGDLRLNGSAKETEGTVEVCLNGQWGTICSDGWTQNNAQVVCRQLGYEPQNAIPLKNAYFGQGSGDVLLSFVNCYGNETAVIQCPYRTLPFCSHLGDAGVICQPTPGSGVNCSARDVRLVDGLNEYQGRVEVCVHGRWGTVCDDNWDRMDGRVVCKQLGYTESEENGIVYVVGGGHFRSGDGLIVLDNVNCNGTEPYIISCPVQGIGVHNCDPREDAGVFCPAPGQACRNGDVRLINSERDGRDGAGRVEVCLGGQWNTYCSQNFDDDHASVICRQLGYRNPEEAVAISAPTPGSGYVISAVPSCRGTESRIADCPVPFLFNTGDIFQRLCSMHFLDVGVVCVVHNDSCSDGDIQLVDGSAENEGRVEICFGNDWGTICDDNWNNEATIVVCRELGYSGTLHVTVHESFFGRGTSPIHLDEVSCTGNEERLVNCSYPGVGIHNCDHSEDVGVICTVPNSVCNNGDLRLVGGATNLEGRVEVCLGGRWGTICDDLWDSREASVVCAQLGYSRSGAISTGVDRFGIGDGLILLDNLLCTGNENRLLECPANDPGLHNCQHNEDSGVICQALTISCTNGDVTLLRGETEKEGTLQLCRGGTWGSVCDEGWSTADAAVVCRQLGFLSARTIGVRGSSFGPGSGNTYITNVRCTGNETTLDDCPSRANASCGSGEHAGVICPTLDSVNCTVGDVRLVGGDTPYEGRVELCIHGRWGTVCDDQWDANDATVVCHQLGYTSKGLSFAVTRNDYFGPGDGFILLDDVACEGTEISLLGCRASELGVHNCRSVEDAAVICPSPNATCVNGDMRLISGGRNGVGRVEVCLGRWTTICADRDWGEEEARVACRKFGFQNIDNATAVMVSGGEGPVFLSELQCIGNESSLLDCNRRQQRAPPFNCLLHRSVAGVVCTLSSDCSDEDNGNVHLVNGTIPNEGRVEICRNHIWGTVCDDQWGRNEARVVCRQLGYADSQDAIPYSNAFFGRGIAPIHLDELRCSGEESSLLDCSHTRLHNCINAEDAGVLCIADSSVCDHGDLRLVNGRSRHTGRVEVCIGGKWGTICDRMFDAQAASVVCRQLGFESKGANFSSFGPGSGPIFLNNLNCNGDELSLLICSRNAAGSVGSCRHSSDVGVICKSAPICRDGDIRLVGGEYESEGTLQFCLGEQWGTVCDDLWSNNDAMVVCRQLGYQSEGAVSVRGAFFGSGVGDIFVSNVLCVGSESQLLDCIHSQQNFFCFHFEDAGVICPPNVPLNCTTGAVRLIGGVNQYEGRVEVCLHGRWGSVCDDGWDGFDAAVVCRQLGYTENGYSYAISNARFGPGSGFIILDSVNCSGNETSLLNCRAQEIGSHDCLATEDAGVICPYAGSSCENGAVRLVGGSNYSGRVELCVGGVWGTVCNSFFWRDSEAEVICRQLGFNDTTVAIAQSSIVGLYGGGTGPILVTSPDCFGWESRITDCSGFHSNRLTFCNHVNDIGVACQPETLCTNGEVKLRGSMATNEGRVEVCIDNNWGTVCDDGWDTLDARVVCNQLGYDVQKGVVIPVPQAFFGMGSGRIHIESLLCNGTESNLLECGNSGVGVHDCSHLEDAGVICPVFNSSCNNGDIRLVNGNNEMEGRVEICFGGRYGTVCDDMWDNIDASVVCRQLGFSPIGAEAIINSFFGQAPDLPIFIDDTMCLGNETALIQCHHIGVGNHNCRHTEDAGVRCRPLPCSEKSFRVTGGISQTSSLNGIIEICVNRMWGLVCADTFTDDLATSACLDMNKNLSSAIRTPSSSFTPSQGSYYNVSKMCEGNNCTITVSNETSCSNGVGVFCPKALSSSDSGSPTVCETGMVRLMGGRSPAEGRVEVCLNDQWGTVCDDSWDESGAIVTCRQLGYSTKFSTPFSGAETTATFGKGVGPIWLDDVKCKGTETNLLSCSQIPFNHKHNCRHTEDAGVSCLDKMDTPGTADTKKSSQSNSSTGVVVAMIIIIVILVLVILVIIAIIVILVTRNLRTGNYHSKNEDNHHDENALVESDFLNKENSMEKEDDQF